MPKSAEYLLFTMRHYELLMKVSAPSFQFTPGKQVFIDEVRLLALTALTQMFFMKGTGMFVF
jgi:hypothetical protein